MKKWLLLPLIVVLALSCMACGKDKKSSDDPFDRLPDGSIVLPEDVFE